MGVESLDFVTPSAALVRMESDNSGSTGQDEAQDMNLELMRKPEDEGEEGAGESALCDRPCAVLAFANLDVKKEVLLSGREPSSASSGGGESERRSGMFDMIERPDCNHNCLDLILYELLLCLTV